jgi:UDP-glucose 4-epimerase
MGLTVAITGPTGEIGLPLLEELERRPEVAEVRGMARRPFDPAAEACIVAGPRATMLIRQVVNGVRLGDPLPRLRRGLGRLPLPPPVLPDSGIPIQLVHHDDVARALVAAITGAGPPGAYNLAGAGEVNVGEIASSIGWRSVRVPGPAVGVGAALATRLRFASPQLEWAPAFSTPVVMDASKARRELGWEPRFDARETLLQTAVAAREAGLLD